MRSIYLLSVCGTVIALLSLLKHCESNAIVQAYDLNDRELILFEEFLKSRSNLTENKDNTLRTDQTLKTHIEPDSVTYNFGKKKKGIKYTWGQRESGKYIPFVYRICILAAPKIHDEL